MPSTNHFKFGASGISSATRGGFSVGVTNGADYGPTSTTGFWNGVTPPAGGYVIYVDKASQGPSIHVASDNAQCIGMLLEMGATGSTIGNVLAWAAGQANMAVLSAELTLGDLPGAGPSIVTSGLVLNLDAGNSSSYPGYGTTWTDLSSSNNNGTLVGGLTYNSSNGGSIVFSDSTPDNKKYITLDASKIPTGNEVSLCFWSYGTSKTTTNTIFNSSISTQRRTISIHQVYTNSNVYWDAGDGDGSFNYDRINSSAISDGQYLGWHYWVYTKNASTGIMNVYLDNSLLITGSGKTKPMTTPTYATIGTDFLNGLMFDGRIGIVNIYNKELISTEITQNFNATKTRFGF